MKQRSVGFIRAAKFGYIIMSVVFILIGLACVIKPTASANVICKVLGAAMLLFGIVKLMGYFSKDLFRLAFQYDLEFGCAQIVLGTIMLIDTEGFRELFVIAIGIVILIDAMFKLRIALDSKQFGIKPWSLILVLAVISGLAGLLLVIRPGKSTSVLMTLLGLTYITEGLLDLVVGLGTVKIVKKQFADEKHVIDVTDD